MQPQFKPQVEASVQAALELANLSFSQFERWTELNLEQVKANTELAQGQVHALLDIKDPATAMDVFKTHMETSALSLAGFASTAFDLGQEFQAESAAFVEAHFDKAHTAANKALIDSLKTAPEGSEVAVNAVKAAVDAGNKAVAEARKNVKQSAKLAQDSLAKLKQHAPKAAAKAPARRKARA